MMYTCAETQVERHVDFLNTIRSSFEGRNESGDVEQQWTELKKALVDAAEQHLHQSRQPRKNWISAETLTLTEEKRLALVMRQNQCTCVEKPKHYAAPCKLVRQQLRTKRNGGTQIWQQWKQT